MISGLFAARQNIPPRPGLLARRYAVHLLVSVLRQRRAFDESLARLAFEDDFTALDARDRAFTRAIAATALRRYGQIRNALSHFMATQPASPRGAFDEIMLAAGAQILFLKSPAHAVIDLTVEQIKEDKEARRYSKLANAVLRRLAGEGPAIVAVQDAEQLNTPGWLWTRWGEAYGDDGTRRIALQHMAEPPLDLSVKSGAAAWAARLNGILLPTGTVRLAGRGRIEEIEGYHDGEWWVQDAAAALPAKLLGDVRGLDVADLCAAPGGKTAQLAAAGARVTSVDHSRPRLKRLEENLARLRLGAEIGVHDAATWQPGRLFDAILLDAPCSATGTIRRNPDIPFLKSAADIASLEKVQARLLDHALALLKPGGRLVYCTCSLEPEEGEAQAARLLTARRDIALLPISAEEAGGHPGWVVDGCLRTLPCYLQLSDPDLCGMDGFFAVRLQKRA